MLQTGVQEVQKKSGYDGVISTQIERQVRGPWYINSIRERQRRWVNLEIKQVFFLYPIPGNAEGFHCLYHEIFISHLNLQQTRKLAMSLFLLAWKLCAWLCFEDRGPEQHDLLGHSHPASSGVNIFTKESIWKWCLHATDWLKGIGTWHL